jgi:Spy/CpxP family protein refolding chaperone
MNMIRLLSAVAATALLAPVGALAQTIPPQAAPPPGSVPAQVAPYPNTGYPGAAYPGTAYPQQAGLNERGPFLRIVNSLPLTNGQRQQIAQYVEATHQEDQGANRRKRRGDRRTLHEQIYGVLTPQEQEQVRTQMQAIHAERHQQRQPRNVTPAQPNTVPLPSNGVGVPNT